MPRRSAPPPSLGQLFRFVLFRGSFVGLLQLSWWCCLLRCGFRQPPSYSAGLWCPWLFPPFVWLAPVVWWVQRRWSAWLASALFLLRALLVLSLPAWPWLLCWGLSRLFSVLFP